MVRPIGASPTPMPQWANFGKRECKTKSETAIYGPIGAAPVPWRRTHDTIPNDSPKWVSKSAAPDVLKCVPKSVAPDVGCSNIKQQPSMESRKEQDSSATSGDVLSEGSVRGESIQNNENRDRRKLLESLTSVFAACNAANFKASQHAAHKISQCADLPAGPLYESGGAESVMMQAKKPEPLHSTASSRSTSPGCGSNSDCHPSATVSPTSACADSPHDFFRFEPMYIPMTSAWILDGQYQPNLKSTEDPAVILMPR